MPLIVTSLFCGSKYLNPQSSQHDGVTSISRDGGSACAPYSNDTQSV